MAKKMTHGRKRIIISIAAILTLVGGGVALAYWTSGGTGDGAATTGTAGTFDITVDGPVGEIAPGNAGETIDFHVFNNGTNTQHLSDVTATLADANGTPWLPDGGCLASDYTVDMSTPAPAGDIAPGGSVDGQVTVTLANTGENQDACQGQSVPVHFVAS